MRAPALLFFIPVLLAAGKGDDLMKSIAATTLDPAECFRVREISIARDEVQIFLTDGYLIFTKPVGSARVSAVFSTDAEGGDAEILLMPPNRSERRSLALHTDSPTLEEHFNATAMVFADDIYRELMEQIRANPYNKKSAEMGALLAERWSPVVRNIDESFSLRLAADLLSPGARRKGFFGAAFAGNRLGAFDLVYDARAAEQILVGKSSAENFDIWSSFAARSYRQTSFAPEFSLKDYRIDSTLDQDLMLHCVTQVKAENKEIEGALPFEISSKMQILTATIDGKPVEVLASSYSRSSVQQGSGNAVFLLVPAAPLAPGVHQVALTHEGKVITDAGNHVYFVGSRGNWYPGRGMQFATFDLTFHSPREFDLVATGDPVSDTSENDVRVTRRKTTQPIRLAGFNLGIYHRARVTRGDFTIEVCANHEVEQGLNPRVPDLTWTDPIPQTRPQRRPTLLTQPPVTMPAAPPDPTARLKGLASEIADLADFYAGRFGTLPIRYLEVSPVPGRFGQGFPGMIYLSTLSYLRPSDRAMAVLDERTKIFFSDLLHAHEVAHQWWGGVVTSAGYHDDWIMEGIANYSALLFLEKHKGAHAVDLVLDDYRNKLLVKRENGETIESIGPVVQGMRLENGWNPIVYGKSTWIIHMLRKRMGDESFLRMMAALRREYEDKSISTEQFRLFCAGFLPPKSRDSKLEAFFDQWVYGTGVPELKLNYSIKGKAPAWRVEGTISGTGAGDDFTADVPVEVRLATGRTVTQVVRAAAEPSSFEIKLASAPAKVAIDSHGILHR